VLARDSSSPNDKFIYFTIDCLPFERVNGKLINSANNFSLVSKFSGLTIFNTGDYLEIDFKRM
jgi:hypothetical protein